MLQFPDNYFDAIITDPPYELNFMGRKWDASGIAYDVSMWQQALRVLKPGGHMLAFGGTRTYHRMACAIEDTGFEIRDCISWVTGQGFPKSLDISKSLDKMAGAEREIIGKGIYSDRGRTAHQQTNSLGAYSSSETDLITAPATPEAQTWAGWGSALKPAHEPIVLARKPLACKTIAENVLEWGCGGLAIDACRIGTGGDRISGGLRSREMDNGSSWQHASANQIERPSGGRFPSNLLWSHSPLCKRIGTKKVKGNGNPYHRTGSEYKPGEIFPERDGPSTCYNGPDGLEEVESWDCHPSCPSWEFAKAGERKSGGGNKAHTNPGMWKGLGTHDYICDQSSGSAARFFKSCPFTDDDLGIAEAIPAFAYFAKASRAEREKGLDGMPDSTKRILNSGITSADHPQTAPGGGDRTCKNNHPTIKPLKLMQYLCKLITPPGGILLDPFAGSGTTCMAAKAEGFRYVGIEKEPEYVEIAKRRISSIPHPIQTFTRS